MLDGCCPYISDWGFGTSICLRDNPRIFYSLSIGDVIYSHSGCINSIKWDKCGKFILSGGDDRCVAITDVFSDAQEKVLFRKDLRAMSNVFTAKFVPDSSTEMIYAGFRCGCVVRVSVNGGVDSNESQLFFCHKMPVYDILTPQDQENCLLTLSHDRTVRLWDTRMPHCIGRDMQPCGRTCFYGAINSASSAHSRLPLIAPTLKFDFPVTAGDIHPIDGSRSIAVASADGFVRLFDMRLLFSSSMDSLAIGSKQMTPHPYQIVRPLGLVSRSNVSREIRLDYGPLFITSVRFEPPHSPFPMTFRRKWRRLKPQYPGRRLLVSHMYSSVFLFDLDRLEEKVEEFSSATDQVTQFDTSHTERIDETNLPVPETAETPVGETTRDAVNPNAVFAMILIGMMARRRAMLLEQNRLESGQAISEGVVEVESANETENNRSNNGPSSPTNAQSEGGDRIAPFDFASDEMIARVLSSCPRARQISSYAGQRSIRTVFQAFEHLPGPNPETAPTLVQNHGN
uniref:WD_REPEATS_REGION domain-containing protein n=2 Tax=Mesocestoides corti TaxID=53468 RepID=A0A5K3FH63_MESCO